MTEVADFNPRHHLDSSTLLELWGWDEATFAARTEGSALRRISFDQWQRNLAVALGNARTSPMIISALRANHASVTPMVREHIEWALARHQQVE